MALMWAGVVPQQPPTMFSHPFAANSRRSRRHHLGGLIESAERIRQPGIRVATHIDWRDAGQLLDVRPHFLRAKRTVDSDAQQRHMRNGIPIGIDGLSGQRPAAAASRDRERDHDRHSPTDPLKILDRLQRGPPWNSTCRRPFRPAAGRRPRP